MARCGAETPGKRGAAAALRGWEGGRRRRRVRGPRQVGWQQAGQSSRESSGSLRVPCSPAASLTFTGWLVAGPPGAGLLPPRRWGLRRLPPPSGPSASAPLRSAAGTGAPLCRIRVEPLPTLKPEPRALAALWRRGVKRLPRTPWGEGASLGPRLGGLHPPHVSEGVCVSMLSGCEPGC